MQSVSVKYWPKCSEVAIDMVESDCEEMLPEEVVVSVMTVLRLRDQLVTAEKALAALLDDA